MSFLDAWNAAIEGNYEALQRVLNKKKTKYSSSIIERRRDNHGWTILHHVAVNGSLKCVQLVVGVLGLAFPRCHEGFTPLARACQRSAPREIVLFLLQKAPKAIVNLGDNEDVTPLHYAVSRDRLDLVEMLLAYGADVRVNAGETPVDIAAFDTGNVEILIHLLFVAKGACPNLRIFCARAHYDIRNKIAVFKILFNLQNPEHMHRQRYELLQITPLALLSEPSRSLIPYFIETELKWEKREVIRCLYEQLLTHNYHSVALLVFLDADHMEKEYESRTAMSIFEVLHERIKSTLVQLVCDAILDEKEELVILIEHILSHLRFTKFIVAQLVPDIFHALIVKLTETGQGPLPYRATAEMWKLYQRIVHSIVPLCENASIDCIVGDIIVKDCSRETTLRLIVPVIGFITDLFMVPQQGLGDKVLFNELLRCLGSWKTVKSSFNTECFTLKRLSRDVVRMAMLDEAKRTQFTRPFFIHFIERLRSLDVPNELKLYIRYCDSDTMNKLYTACDNLAQVI